MPTWKRQVLRAKLARANIGWVSGVELFQFLAGWDRRHRNLFQPSDLEAGVRLYIVLRDVRVDALERQEAVPELEDAARGHQPINPSGGCHEVAPFDQDAPRM